MSTSVMQAPIMSEGGAKPPRQSTHDFKEVRVVKEGTRIIIPEGMSYADARTWLSRQEEAEEKVVALRDEIACYPLDGVVAVMLALKEIYGFASLENTPGFFGPTPPMLVQVDIGGGKFETAPLGRIAIPKWEGGFLETHVMPQAALVLTGEIKRKFEPELKRVIGLAREKLKKHSIYKGRAASIDLTFMHNPSHKFDPIKDAPQFMDVETADESGLILNPVTESELRANIYIRIERTAACIKNNIPLKHGALFMGPFGTGKTLASRVLAKKCVANNWTFLYLKHPEHLAAALRIAQLYAPAVVFTEDIDQAMQEGRCAGINEILNTIDGVDTKDKPIITIMTTNNADAIEPAFLRAGRIDTVIMMDAPDQATSIRFVHKFARDDDNYSLLASDTDLTEAGNELAGFVPAFIAEAVQKAKCLAIEREGEDVVGKVTGGDIALAARALKKHAAMVQRKKQPTDPEIVAKAVMQIGEWQSNGSVDTK